MTFSFFYYIMTFRGNENVGVIMVRKNFIELDNLQGLFRYSENYTSQLQRQLSTYPYSMTIPQAQEKIQEELARLLNLSIQNGAIKVYMLLSKGYSHNLKSVHIVNKELDKILNGKGVKPLESFINHLNKDRGKADFALNLLESYDPETDQQKIKLIAKATNLVDEGIISAPRLLKDGPAISNTDLIRIAVSKNLKGLFMKSIKNIDHTASDILDSSENLSIPNEWCREALKDISPEENMLAFKLLLKEAEIDALDSSILRSYKEFPTLKVLKALILSDDITLFKKVLKLFEGIGDDYTSIEEILSSEKEYNAQLKDLAQLAYDCESTEILNFMALRMLLEDDDSNSFELFDDIVSKLGGVNVEINKEGQTIFQLIVEQGNLDLLIHAKEKFLEDPLLRQEAVIHRDIKGFNAVHYAARFQDISFIEELSDMEGFNHAVNVNSPFGYPLYIAYKKGDLSEYSVPYFLLDKGANVAMSFSNSIDLLKGEIELAKSEGEVPAVYQAFERALNGEYPIPVKECEGEMDIEIDLLIEAIELGLKRQNTNESNESEFDTQSIHSNGSGNSDSGCEMPLEDSYIIQKGAKGKSSFKEDSIIDFMPLGGSGESNGLLGDSVSPIYFLEIQE